MGDNWGQIVVVGTWVIVGAVIALLAIIKAKGKRDVRLRKYQWVYSLGFVVSIALSLLVTAKYWQKSIRVLPPAERSDKSEALPSVAQDAEPEQEPAPAPPPEPERPTPSRPPHASPPSAKKPREPQPASPPQPQSPSSSAPKSHEPQPASPPHPQSPPAYAPKSQEPQPSSPSLPQISPAAPESPEPKPWPSPGMPRFPWPPPIPSARLEIPLEMFPDRTTFGKLAIDLESALRKAGYLEKSYYAVPYGMAVVTRLEQIDADGRPFVGESRWQIDPSRAFSLANYLQRLFAVEEGHFRVVVFIVTVIPFSSAQQHTTPQEANLWLSNGFNRPTREFVEMRLPSSTSCTALIYEFRKRHGEDPQVQLPSLLSAQQHMDASGLTAALASLAHGATHGP